MKLLRYALLSLSLLLAPSAASARPARVAHAQLQGEVDEDSVALVKEQIAEANENGAKEIVLLIDSPGGSVPDGYDLIKAIETSKAPVVCVVDGSADSMAFAILQSCQRRLMTRRSVLMAHQLALGGMFRGQPSDWQNIADMMKAMADALAEQCAHRLKVSVDEYKSRTDRGREWWFSASDAIKFGAVDAVVPFSI